MQSIRVGQRVNQHTNIVSITEELKTRADETGCTDTVIARSIMGLADHLVSQAQVHLKRIIIQHPSFDLHDETHSAAVVKNMEFLLGPSGIKARSVFELFRLITSAYLHDCAMAVPESSQKSDGTCVAL